MDTGMIQGHAAQPLFFSPALAISRYLLQYQAQQTLAQTHVQLPDDLDSLGLQEQDKKDLLAAVEDYNKLAARYLDIEHEVVCASASLITTQNQLYEARSRVESATCKRSFVIDREYRLRALNDASRAFQRASCSPSPSSPSVPSSSTSCSSSPPTSPSVHASPCALPPCLPQHVL
ncbi:hypothetical protein PILCRDRAFT_825125 [Piloderma croceum F 1598]|uniref:Uncharacterized protein n=1 Tax=Piloderma croceum (strain F 1598) TaxID=765440 RepID=A0A0C3EYU1_PILCF|nr:hypothetical protein PILCRDRAFT_825125 [Piloderma croceum F 1598]